MKRFTLYGIIFVFSAVLIYAGWRGAAWLVGTEEGARWALDSVSRHTPLKISAHRVEGRLLDHLSLSDVHLIFDPFALHLRRMDCDWRPFRLLSGMVAIDRLTLTGVRVIDKSAERHAPSFAWPQVSGFASLFDISIKKLKMDDVSYIVPPRQAKLNLNQAKLNFHPLPLTDMSFQCSVLWRHSSLTIRDLLLLSPYGRVKGEIAAGFYQPALWVDLHFASQRHFVRMDNFSIQGRFQPGYRAEQIAGDFTVGGSSGSLKLFELKGKAGMTDKAFNFRDLRLSRPGRGGMITGEGSVIMGLQKPLLSFQFSLEGVDLAEELKAPTKLDGAITLRGAPSCYRGDFKIENNACGWKKAHLSGNYAGTGSGIKIDHFSVSLLSGTVEGALSLDWQKGFLAKGLFHGRDIDPADFNPDIAGKINFDLEGTLALAADGTPSGRVEGKILKSLLHGQPLSGALDAQFGGGFVNVEKLRLNGNGFGINGSGILRERLTFDARIGDMGRLFSGAAGQATLAGWMRFRSGQLSGEASGHAQGISIKGVKIRAAELSGFLGTQRDASMRIHADLRDLSYKNFLVDSVSLKMRGMASKHGIQVALKRKKTEMELSLRGELQDRSWRGKVERFSGRDDIGPWRLAGPAFITASAEKLDLTSLALISDKAERLEMSGALTQKLQGGFFEANWTGVNMKRLRYLFPGGVQGAGLITGKMEGKMFPEGHVHFKGETSVSAAKLNWRRNEESLEMLIPAAEFSWSREERIDRPAVHRLTGWAVVNGSIATKGKRVSLRQGYFSVKGNGQGVSAEVKFFPQGGGVLKAGFSSVEPLAFALPKTGSFDAHWTDIDSGLLCFLLPETVKIKARLTGKANGNLVSEGRLFSTGEVYLSPPIGADEGKISFLKKKGEMNVNFRSASLLLAWKERTLNGDVSVSLGEFGRLQGTFRLPVSASLPVSIEEKGPLYVSLNGKLKENGLLTYLFPGAIEKSHAEIDANLVVEGSWKNPLGKGRLKFANAGAYLPFAGIDVTGVEIVLAWENDVVKIDSFQAQSGPGMIYGNGVIRLDKWRVSGFEGNVTGSDFQLVYLPELQVRGTPRLTFRGTPEKLTLRGELKLPELLIFGPPAGNFVAPSTDVIFEGKPRSRERILLPVFDAKVRLTLGDRCLVKMEGIDAKLAGSINLDFQSIDKIASKGEIRAVTGSYNAYGVDLQIRRGRLFYSGGPINQPALDILALRSVAGVKAGVTIGGVLSAPVIKLYSEPVMSDVDILSYIVFGHSLSSRSNAEQISTLTQAAGFFLSQGKAASFQQKLKKKLGLSTLDIQSRQESPAGSIGYKKMNAHLSAAAASPQADNISETFVAVGKYLTPQLYLSYGRSLFTGNNIFSLRYDVGKKWQVETVTGTESGIDLYYKIDFK